MNVNLKCSNIIRSSLHVKNNSGKYIQNVHLIFQNNVFIENNKIYNIISTGMIVISQYSFSYFA